MKDLILIVLTTLITVVIWAGMKPKDLVLDRPLEKVKIISDTIDVDFLKEIASPAYEQ